ncbi:aldose 1-epimerase family protein [Saccharopolyspora taberi]|uniref:aldose 1-epimerase family protein n=1 Tax=Saccharopolyspora taberi TaxID=60895 RepID=UPI0031CE02AF
MWFPDDVWFLDELTPGQLRQRVGSLAQVAGIDRFCEEDGLARGARRFQVRTGSGLVFDVLPDRGLDLGAASFRGVPLAWISPAGHVAPGHAEHAGAGWQRTFGGGLLTTCGLDQFGAPSTDGGQDFGLHGRASSTPAQQVNAVADGRLEVTGRLRQTRLFGENLVLDRTIASGIGSRAITVTDTVTNDGFQSQPHMLLYHMNLGWPLVSPAAVLRVPGSRPVARDADAERGLDFWDRFTEPDPGFAEQVFRHDFAEAGPVEVRLENPELGLALGIRFDTRQLPGLFQWKMLGAGSYVLGVEPANCRVIAGRGAARAEGELPVLEPGESRSYSVSVEVSPTTGTP